jgi:iron complex outermembrane receptor protein
MPEPLTKPSRPSGCRPARRAAVILSALIPIFAVLPAFAQSVPQTEIIEVTGSRLKNTDAQSANPITIVTSEDIAKTAATSVEQILMKLPFADFTGGFTANSSNGGYGASQGGLRNLGPARTLILLNGQRFPLTDAQGTIDAVDLNNIPVSMIDHIEILRDGASSIYGADAIAGVINIITKQHFDGVEVGGSVGETSYGDGLRHSVYSTVGADFDRGNILINVGTDHTDGISQGARAWGVSQHPEAGVNAYGALSAHITGAIGLIGGNQYYYGTGGIAAPILATQAYTLGTIQVSPGVFSGGGLTSGDLAIADGGVGFNYLPTQGLTAGLDRRQLNVTTHYDLTPDVTAVLDGFYTDRQSMETLNPEPIGYDAPTPKFPNGLYSSATYVNNAGQTVPNPYNPTNAANAAALYGADNVGTNVPILTRRTESGPRIYTDDIETYRIRAGLQGTLFGKYEWEADYLYGQSSARYDVANETNLYHLSQELGMTPCAGAPGCSIANVFGYDTLTPAQARYLSFTNTDTSEYTEQIASGHIGGPIRQLPAGPLGLVVGIEYRADTLFDHPSSITIEGDAPSFSVPTSGNYATASGDAEINAPLLSNLPFVKMLTLDITSRYDYNTTFGRSLTYKAGFDYALNDDFRLRGSRSTGVRAPQLRELYTGTSQALVSGSDPCAPGNVFSGSAPCLASLPAGVMTASLNTGTQIPVTAGGNPSLKPERSQEWTFGGVATPHWVPGLSISLDFYSILIRNEIGTYDANQLLAACFGGVPYLVSQPNACQLVGPRTSTGSLGPINLINANIGAENTDGIDVDLAYGVDTTALGLPAWGHLAFDGQLSFLLSDDVTANGLVQQQAGTFSGDDGRPRFKALASLQFARDYWSVGWTARGYGTLANCTASTKGALDFEGNETAGVFYHDISGTYRYRNVNLTIGVDNLFDKDPPFLTPTGQSNSAGSAGYDFNGRFIYMKVSVKF